MLEKCTYALGIDQSRSKSIEKCSFFIIFEFGHDATPKMQLRVSFQNLSSSKSAGKKIAVFMRTANLPFSIRHIFHRLKNVPLKNVEIELE